jgi:hypothetical protein
VPGKYPFPARSFILENRSANGPVKFEDVTSTVAPDLLEAGMVTAALCTMQNDQWTDLVVAGNDAPLHIQEP